MMDYIRGCLVIVAASLTMRCDAVDTACTFRVLETEFQYGADVIDWNSYWASVDARHKQPAPDTTAAPNSDCSSTQMGKYIGGVGSPQTGFQAGLSDKHLRICMNGVCYLHEVLNSTVYPKMSFQVVCDAIDTIDDDISVSHWSISDACSGTTGIMPFMVLVHRDCEVVRPRVVVRKVHVVSVDATRNLILSLEIPLGSPAALGDAQAFAAIDRERAVELTRKHVAEDPVLRDALDYEALPDACFFVASGAPYWIVWFPPKNRGVEDSDDSLDSRKVIWGWSRVYSAAWPPVGRGCSIDNFDYDGSEIHPLPILVRPHGIVDIGTILPKVNVGYSTCHQKVDFSHEVIEGWIPTPAPSGEKSR